MLKPCLHCGADFHVKPSQAERTKFCQQACRRSFEAKNGRLVSRAKPVMFSCKTCGTEFSMKPSYLVAYRKKFSKDPLYCSIPCSAKARRMATEERSVFTCLQCGKENRMKRYEGTGRTVYYRQQKFCNIDCKATWQKEHAKKRFDEQGYRKHIKRGGYVWISIPALASRTGKKREMLEHRYVMEQHLGRELFPDETVHHKNGNRSENSIDNLELFSSRHGPGQRVIDKIAFAIEMIRRYPEFARDAGVELHDLPT